MFQSEGRYLCSMISRANWYADETTVPPDSPCVKNCSSVTSRASVWCEMKTISTLSYFVRRKRTIQKKKERGIYFLNSPMEPDTSIMEMTTAFDSKRCCSSQDLNLKSSFLTSPNCGLP